MLSRAHFVVILACVSACVSSGTYNRKVADLTKQRADDAAAAKTREQALSDKLATDDKSIVDLTTQLGDANAQKGVLQAQLDNATQLIETLKQRLEQLGQNLDS